jgi:[ribosomal protein S5]-alanine N-acetyltransferase
MRIETSKCILREWQLSDAESLAFYANNRNVSCNLRDFFPFPYTINNAYNWIELAAKQDDPQTLFAIEVDGIAAGSIGIVKKDDVYRKNIEIGYFLGEKFWARGIATEAIKAITKYAFENFEIERVFAEFFSSNIGSKKALEKSGFKHEASFKNNIFKNGKLQDSCIYSVLKEDYFR